jgi:molybdopterin-guanine dinucleotide biosynthesis protein A
MACNIGSVFPLCLGIRRALAPAVDAYIAAGGRSIHRFIAMTSCEIITDAPAELFMNLNTESDYVTALRSCKP